MHIFITGGAGFIGSNSADYFLREGHRVTLYDNLSRPGTPHNLAWLSANHGERLELVRGDVRDFDRLASSLRTADVVIHLAGQVAVTTSVANPRHDFEVNALGTFNLLEAVRLHNPGAIVLNASTNKVYGGMTDLRIREEESRYAYADYPLGIPESFPLDFHSPYGCSKGAADQYVVDYARIYGLKSVTLRQSCIYGPRQFGLEDQGWVAFFVIAAVLDRPLTIFGNGKQVRDILYVDDLVLAYDAVIRHIDRVKGEALNLGGGPANTLSIWAEFEPLLSELRGRPLPVHYGGWRPGDQRVFIADVRKAQEKLGWFPRVSPRDGISRLFDWVKANRALFTG